MYLRIKFTVFQVDWSYIITNTWCLFQATSMANKHMPHMEAGMLCFWPSPSVTPFLSTVFIRHTMLLLGASMSEPYSSELNCLCVILDFFDSGSCGLHADIKEVYWTTRFFMQLVPLREVSLNWWQLCESARKGQHKCRYLLYKG